MRYYSKTTGSTYYRDIHQNIPSDAVQIGEERYLEVIANPAHGKHRSHRADGLPILIDPPLVLPSAAALCEQIDRAADSVRAAVVGDPTRIIEYDRAAAEAAQFKSAGYPVDNVPRTVAAWAINGRTAREAADSILAEAASYTEALYQIREARLHAKQAVITAIAAGDWGAAEQIASDSITAITRAAAGVGDNVK